MSSDNQTYYDWLKNQPSGFQDVAIGRDNAAKLRSGEIDSERFYGQGLHQKFAPISLSEIKELEGLTDE